MFAGRRSVHLLMLIVILQLVLAGCEDVEDSHTNHLEQSIEDTTSNEPKKPSALARLFFPSNIELDVEPDNSIGTDDSEWADSVLSNYEVSFVSQKGDSYRILFKCYTQQAPDQIAEIVAHSPCTFSVAEKTLLNSIINITAFKNKRRFFSRDLRKSDFSNVLNRGFLKNHHFVGADLFAFNERYQQCIFRINLAQQFGGTEWFGQVYYVIDSKGRPVVKGLSDYPYHCQDIMTLSNDGNYLLTCNEIANLKNGERYPHPKGKVALSKFINDSLYTLVYDLTKDSLVCDTTIYWKKDTLTYQQKIKIPDSTSKNAYIVNIKRDKRDTLAKFTFKGFTAGTQGYFSEYAKISKLNLVAYYDKAKKMLRTFEVDKNFTQRTYILSKLDRMPLRLSDEHFFEFFGINERGGKNKKVRFYVNNLKKVVGYTVIDT